MTGSFVRQPLLKLLNRQNPLTRIEKLERRGRPRPSASVDQLEELTSAAPNLFTSEYTFTNVYVESDGTKTQISPVLSAVKEADQTHSSTGTGFIDDDDLSVTVEADAFYVFDLYVYATANDDTPDINMDWTMPASTAGVWGAPGRDVDNATNPGLSPVGAPGAVSTTSISIALSMGLKSGESILAKFSGNFQTANSGTMQFRWAHLNTSGVAWDVTVKRGSALIVTKVG